MDITVMLEARRNPDVNKKTSVNDRLDKWFDKVRQADYSYYVSFTEVDKIGINPSSEYETPLGVYTYPLRYLKDLMAGGKATTEVPFMGHAPFVNVVKAAVKVVDLGKVDESDLNKYMAKLVEYLERFVEEGESARIVLNRFYREAELSDHALHGEFLWEYSRLAKNWVAERTGRTPAVVWNSVFRAMGIGAVVDHGNGIIHENEPTQAVFFSMESFELVERIRNGKSSAELKLRQGYRKLTTDQAIEKIKKEQLVGYDARHIDDPDAFLAVMRQQDDTTFRSSFEALETEVKKQVIRRMTLEEVKHFYLSIGVHLMAVALEHHGQPVLDFLIDKHGDAGIMPHLRDVAYKKGLKMDYSVPARSVRR